jgi:hypothetical protein
MAHSRRVGQPFDEAARRRWAEVALRAELVAQEVQGSRTATDLLEPDGWRWRVLEDMTVLSGFLNESYELARTHQKRQAWQSRFGGPIATGGGAAIGSIVSAVGAGLIKTNAVAGWVIVIVGVVLAVFASVFSASTYVQNRNKVLRYLRLLHDIWDWCYMVLPTVAVADAFTQLDTFRGLWETAGL